MAILEAHKVTKRFGGLTAVGTFDVSIRERSIHSIIGPNGAGKTTFFNCITGFYRHEEGTILYKGEPLDGMSPDGITRQGIARTYQNIRLFQNMTVIENVLVRQHYHMKAGIIGAIIRGKRVQKEEAEAVAKARETLKFIGLAGRGDWMSKNLPYGDQRRLEIARAL
ncbi:MAG TPA: ATP-binding cassette domain-containing protein, partial [Anaerolineae bacterium]|nr:ATP-binding cassette domain-containing protein [Anaerolineae bacterium]